MRPIAVHLPRCLPVALAAANDYDFGGYGRAGNVVARLPGISRRTVMALVDSIRRAKPDSP